MSTEIVTSPELACSRAALWAFISQMDGINTELMPYLKMSAPSEARGKTVDDVPLGKRAFTSVILLFGIVPLDSHFVRVAERFDGIGFIEDSTTLMNKRWRHQRTISDTDAGVDTCSITDVVTFEARIKGVGRLVAPAIRSVFAHRHKRLRERFGTPTGRLVPGEPRGIAHWNR